MSTAISSPTTNYCLPLNSQIIRTFNSSSSSITCLKSPNNYGKRAVEGVFLRQKLVLQKRVFWCNCIRNPGEPAPGENESKEVLDAFFLGKAFAEALNERIESTVGEFLSTVGRLQAEQQRQVQEFQDEVLERAKNAKEKAAREALEAQGIVSKPVVAKDIVSSSIVNETTNVSAAIDESTISSSSSNDESSSPNDGSTDPLLGISIDD